MTNRIPATSILTGAAIIAGAVALTHAGPLDPPAGPVAPTHKTLTQVEPRTPIHAADLPFTIDESGSYYLAEPVNTSGGGITVDADYVTIDLMGFALRGGTGDGISASNPHVGLTIRNGVIAEWAGAGVQVVSVEQCTIESVQATNNGEIGLAVGAGSVVAECSARGNGDVGVLTNAGSTIARCTALDNTQSGFFTVDGCVVSVSTARGNGAGGGDGFNLGSDVRIVDSAATENAGHGISVSSGSSVQDCTANNNDGDGVVGFGAWNVISGNQVVSNGDDGVETTAFDMQIESNHVVANASSGLQIAGDHNYLADNIVRDNADNYTILDQTNHLNLLISEIPETIDWPASVRLAGTLNAPFGSTGPGLEVTADDVSIDLGGHALIGPGTTSGGSALGISGSGQKNVSVRDGAVTDWDEAVVVGDSGRARNVRVADADEGIFVGNAGVVTNCSAASITGRGVESLGDAVVIGCASFGSGTGFANNGLCAFSVAESCAEGFRGTGAAYYYCAARGATAVGFETSNAVIGCSVETVQPADGIRDAQLITNCLTRLFDPLSTGVETDQALIRGNNVKNFNTTNSTRLENRTFD